MEDRIAGESDDMSSRLFRDHRGHRRFLVGRPLRRGGEAHITFSAIEPSTWCAVSSYPGKIKEVSRLETLKIRSEVFC